ncbi:MAG: NUDIX domain-containing protein [Patescibacteria group bacterium]|nr:NUDIX domain-containing protein [Patescibacteria group bacterium]
MNTCTQQIVVVHGIYINPRHELLLVKKGDLWILPGGKLKPHETDEQCLKRGVKEELPFVRVTKVGDIYGVFIGTTPHSHREIKEIVYQVSLRGDIILNRNLEARYVPFTGLVDVQLSELTWRVVSALIKSGYYG